MNIHATKTTKVYLSKVGTPVPAVTVDNDIEPVTDWTLLKVVINWQDHFDNVYKKGISML